MSDDDPRALVERLEAIAKSDDARAILSLRWHEPTGEPDWRPFDSSPLSEILTQAAAALTALVAERDEARNILALSAPGGSAGRLAERFRAVIDDNIASARHAAFARAKEIAERWRPQSVATGFALDLELWAAAQIAAAIEAEMRSDEIQHSVQPLA